MTTLEPLKKNSAYRLRMGTIGEYMAMDFLTYQSHTFFSGCRGMAGKRFDHLTYQSQGNYHGCDILGTSYEQLSRRLRDKYLEHRKRSIGNHDEVTWQLHNFLEKKRVMAQVIEVKTNSRESGAANLQGKQRNIAGIRQYIERVKQDNRHQSGGIASALKLDRYFHSYLIHIRGVWGKSAEGRHDVYLDLYDWGQCVINDLFSITVDNARAMECRLGSWVLERTSNTIGFLDELLKNESDDNPVGSFWRNATSGNVARSCYRNIRNLPWKPYIYA